MTNAERLLQLLSGFENSPLFSLGHPTTRIAQGPEAGEILEIAQVGGLHHRYERRAA